MALFLTRAAAAALVAVFAIAAGLVIAATPSFVVFGAVVGASAAWCAWIERQDGPL
jgi:hypothetical protein